MCYTIKVKEYDRPNKWHIQEIGVYNQENIRGLIINHMEHYSGEYSIELAKEISLLVSSPNTGLSNITIAAQPVNENDKTKS